MVRILLSFCLAFLLAETIRAHETRGTAVSTLATEVNATIAPSDSLISTVRKAKETFVSIHRDTTLRTREKIKHYGGIIGRFIRAFNDIDTTYITPQHYHLTAMMQETNHFEYFKLRGGDNNQSITFAPKPSFKVGPYFGWHMFVFGWTIDPTNFNNGKKTNKVEFEASLYSSMIGCDLLYLRTGEDFKIVGTHGFGDLGNSYKNTDFSGMQVDLTSMHLYYIFNHRHFSYPAAYSQSTVQRRSCGTWKMGFAYARHNIDFDYTALPSALLTNTEYPYPDELKFTNIQYHEFSVSAGYAYNWVFARNCLFSLSFEPSIGYKHTKGDYDNLPTTKEKLRNFFSLNKFNIDYIGRAGLVWNDNRFYGGASLVVHSFNYWKNSLSSSNTILNLNVYFGLNFLKQKKYRRR
jgi:hypothetical protein